MDEARLERIEHKLDRMNDAIVSLARMEERMMTLFRRMDSYDGEMKALLKRIAELERVSIGRGVFFRLFDKVIWLLLGGGITLGVAYLQSL